MSDDLRIETLGHSTDSSDSVVQVADSLGVSQGSVSNTYGPAHDPLCRRDDIGYLMTPCICDVIAKVREDERRKSEMHNYHMPAWTDGYATALRDSVEAVAALWHEFSNPQDNDDAVAAIEALGGER